MTSSNQAMRFLGFAFASADLLFEVSGDGVIGLALGAARKVTGGDVALSQSSWRVLFDPSDYGVFAALIASVNGGGRKGPVRCRLRGAPGKPPRYANVYACALPQLAPNISCAISLSAAGDVQDQGMMSREVFEQSVTRLLEGAKEAGIDVELALIEVAGLSKAVKDLNADAADAAINSLTDVLRAEAVQGAATQIEAERFAVIRETPSGVDTLTDRLKQAAADAGVSVSPQAAVVALSESGSSQTLRALRFTLDHFLKDGVTGDGDVAAVFRGGLDETLRQSRAFTDVVKTRRFSLVFQPIVDLASKELHHYEALVRFSGGDGPYETIRMAEELDLIEDFDLAVAEKAISALRRHGPDVRIAVNVSGRSFLRPKFLNRLMSLTDGDARLKARLMFEITESAALVNLELADERIQRLRREGYHVCIDDFGAGAASLSYLRNLTVDIVKIDGQYVKGIEDGGRDGTVVRHLTALCRELGVHTIAEMVETEAAAKTLKGLGVDMGQGFLFGAPLTEIPLPPTPVAARRKGTVTSWG